MSSTKLSHASLPLLPIDISDDKKESIKVGEPLEVTVDSIETDRRRMSLSYGVSQVREQVAEAQAYMEKQAAPQQPEASEFGEMVAAAQGRHEEAIRHVRAAMEEAGDGLGGMVLGSIYEQAGKADSAIAAYETYVENTEPIRIYWDRLFLPESLERLGALHDEAGDLEQAALYYARFVELWEEADPELQPRVEAARARLEEIVRERG